MADMNESGLFMPSNSKKYFLLNIKEGEPGKKTNEVYKWIIDNKFAPIFFKGHTIEQFRDRKKVLIESHHIKKSHSHTDAETFVETFLDVPNTDDKIVFSIGKTEIYFFKKADNFKLVPYEADKEDQAKGFKIELLKKCDIIECPLVLANIKANLGLALGTFKELKEPEHSGNIRAIEYCLSGEKATITKFPEYLKCLSSVELETLIAKILEEKELFIFAYRGGFIKNFDLICQNFGKNPIELRGNEILPGEKKSIQVKLTLKNTDYKPYEENHVDFYFCINSDLKREEKNVFEAKDIEKLLDKTSYDWLKKSLYWAEFLNSHNML